MNLRLRAFLAFACSLTLLSQAAIAYPQQESQPEKPSTDASVSAGSSDNDDQGQSDKPVESAGTPTEESPKSSVDATVKRLDAVEESLTTILKKLDAISAASAKKAASEDQTGGDDSKSMKPATATLGEPQAVKDEVTSETSAQAAEQSSGGQASGQRRSRRERENRTRPTPLSLELQDNWLKSVPFRSIGPANMSGRIVDIDVSAQDPSLWYIATASGGLLKTNNRGITVEHQFDSESAVSIGAVASDPNNKDVVWVGTGEANPRNSVSYGNGIYKSSDGGKTWKHLGLKETYQISRILVDPTNSDIVYVGALGRLYGANRQRGVYKTSDGGETWEQVLYIDDNTGVIDMIMHPEDPQTIIVAMWDRQRDGFDSWPGSEAKPDGVDGYDPIRKYGPGAGLYKTKDGGANWTKLTNGLPPGQIGRVGLDWQSKSPHAIYAIIDCEDIGKGPKPFPGFLGLVGLDRDGKALITQVFPDSPAAKAGAEPGDVLVSVEGKDVKSYEDLNEVLREKKLGGRIILQLQRGDKTIDVNTKLIGRPGTRTQVPTVWLGVTGEDSDNKIVLRSISKGGPAEAAGLKAGDVITKFDGEQLENYAGLIAQVQELVDGETGTVTVLRGEEELEVEVTFRNRPVQGSQPSNSAYMGIQGEDAPGGGAAMTVVTEDGPSDKGGLKAGDIVVKVGEEKIDDYAALIAQIRNRNPEDEMKLTVKRGEESLELTVTLGDRNATTETDRPYTYSYYGQLPNAQDMQGVDGYKYGGIYKSTDAGETWERVNSLNTRPMYFSVIRVDPSDENRIYVMGVSQFQSSDGGVTFAADFGRGVHADAHDLWIDPADGRHIIIGGDGGFYVTYDRGQNWDHINNVAIGQFYHVAIRPTAPYWVVGGLQDNGSWGGPAISKTGGAINEDWISIGGGDGFVCQVDPEDPDLIYSESQNGSMSRRHLKTGERASIRPAREEGIEYRFNWRTPFILSPHNSKIFLAAGNYVFRSLDRGNDLKRISPEITLTKRGSATALAQSPIDADVMYVGTDDGALWVTRNGGTDWTNITEKLGAPKPLWVSTVEASRFEAGRVYVTLDGHRSDDDAPYAFVSEDFGETFSPLHRNLPVGSTRCLREDIANPNVLLLGTEFALWVSVDRGRHWTQFNQNLPSVAIHDIAFHPDNGEVVLATHGRSLWAFDISPLRGLDGGSFTEKASLLPPVTTIRWRREPSRGGTNRRYQGENPGSGAVMWYTLPGDVKSVKLRVEDVKGDKLAEIDGSNKAGIHRAGWDLRVAGGQRFQLASTGSYKVTLAIDGKDVQSQILEIVSDPSLPGDAVSDEVYELDLEVEASRSAVKAAAKRTGVDVRYDD